MNELDSILTFLKTGGSIVVVNWIISWGLEDLPWWHRMASKTRELISLGLASLVGLLAYQVSIDPNLMEAIKPIASVLISVSGSWYAMQLLHKKNPNRKE